MSFEIRAILKSTLSNLVVVGVGILILCVLVVGSQYLYSAIDTTEFPKSFEVAEMTEENDKAIALLNAATNQLRAEMDSSFGWSANDILFNTAFLDNRGYRQLGVYNATKSLIDNYSLTIARLGHNDKENPNLLKARQNYFSLAPNSWGILGFWASAEGYYNDGFKELDTYAKDLAAGKAKYNMKADDVYESYNIIVGDRVLGYALGLLETADTTPFYQLDNNIYEVQGIVLVVRDFVKALYTLYPSETKNNIENYEYAMRYMDLICTFDPVWISAKPFNSGALIRSYLLNVKNRLEDIRNSIKI